MRVEVNRLSDALGAEITGVDLRQPPGETLACTLNECLLEHIVLVIRDQTLTPGEYVAAMRTFGVPGHQTQVGQVMAEHPEIWVIDSRDARIGAQGQRVIYGAQSWHTDQTDQAQPPKITSLYAVQLPPRGGDTGFANAYALYERLPAETRAQIDSLRTVNGAARHLSEADGAEVAMPAVHPLVRTHPETGRRALYVHPLKLQYIEGMTPQESAALIDKLLEEALGPEVIYQHRWRCGDLGIIDNRACLHRALTDYDPDAGRVMRRITIGGDRPA